MITTEKEDAIAGKQEEWKTRYLTDIKKITKQETVIATLKKVQTKVQAQGAQADTGVLKGRLGNNQVSQEVKQVKNKVMDLREIRMLKEKRASV